MKKRITIFVNGNYLSFDYEKSVEPNLVAWLKTMMDNPERKMTWVSAGDGDGDPLTVELKGSQVDGYYLRNVPKPPPDNQSKLMKMLERLTGQDGDDWKKG